MPDASTSDVSPPPSLDGVPPARSLHYDARTRVLPARRVACVWEYPSEQRDNPVPRAPPPPPQPRAVRNKPGYSYSTEGIAGATPRGAPGCCMSRRVGDPTRMITGRTTNPLEPHYPFLRGAGPGEHNAYLLAKPSPPPSPGHQRRPKDLSLLSADIAGSSPRPVVKTRNTFRLHNTSINNMDYSDVPRSTAKGCRAQTPDSLGAQPKEYNPGKLGIWTYGETGRMVHSKRRTDPLNPEYNWQKLSIDRGPAKRQSRKATPATDEIQGRMERLGKMHIHNQMWTGAAHAGQVQSLPTPRYQRSGLPYMHLPPLVGGG